MNKVYLLIGGNMGDREKNLRDAVRWIDRLAGPVTRISSLYETAAWGKTDQPAFLNQALGLSTPLGAEALMKTILAIEEKMGRKREEKYGPRIIDIDILFFNEDRLQTPLVTVPHPEIPNRRFALAPLQEIAPEWRHPVLGKTVTELLAECRDSLPVKKISAD